MKGFSVWVLGALFIAGTATALPLDFDTLARAVNTRKNDIKSVETLLSWISRNHPEFLERFTLMRKSGSLQGGSPRRPRAIVFGADARFILAFNGDPAHAGYDAVEMIQFREPAPARAWFEFREIRFRPHGKSAVVSAANPGKCARCHFTPERPIWEPYETWDGAYGKHDDAIIDFKNDKYAFTGQENGLIAEHTRDLADYAEFQKIQATDGRYKWLRFPEGSSVSPFSPRHRGEYKFRPNLKLTELLVTLNGRRVAAMLLAESRRRCLDATAESLLARLKGCGTGDSASGESFGSALKRLDIEQSDLNLRAVPTRWSYYQGSAYAGEILARELYPPLRGRYPGLPEKLPSTEYEYSYSRPYPGNDESGSPEETKPEEGPVEKFCRGLEEHAAKRKLADPAEACRPVPRANGSPPPAVSLMCASCHDGSEPAAPRIAFDRPEEIRRDSALVAKIRARVEATGNLRMPPTRALTDREKRELFESVTGR